MKLKLAVGQCWRMIAPIESPLTDWRVQIIASFPVPSGGKRWIAAKFLKGYLPDNNADCVMFDDEGKVFNQDYKGGGWVFDFQLVKRIYPKKLFYDTDTN